jgi:hypothetical protein
LLDSLYSRRNDSLLALAANRLAFLNPNLALSRTTISINLALLFLPAAFLTVVFDPRSLAQQSTFPQRSFFVLHTGAVGSRDDVSGGLDTVGRLEGFVVGGGPQFGVSITIATV